MMVSIMHTISVSFDDVEWKELLEAKGEDTWREWILKCAGNQQ